MQDTITIQKPETDLRVADMALEDRSRLVGAFVWLIQEDKKQNPALYQKKIKHDD